MTFALRPAFQSFRLTTIEGTIDKLVKKGPVCKELAIFGGVAERPIASVLKTDNAERRSRVQIPPPPLTMASGVA
jgi:hypothetical protein